jgi:hypothetical protein
MIHEISRIDEFIDRQKVRDSKGRRERRMENWCQMVTGFLFGVMEKFGKS